MATLNVKNLPDDLYERLRACSVSEHRSIAQQVIHVLSLYLEAAESRSILELKGMGKDLWRDVHPAHVRQERDSWD